MRNPDINLKSFVKSMSIDDKELLVRLVKREVTKEHLTLKAEYDDRDVCAVCFEEQSGKMARLDCNHQYHFNCIRETLEREFRKCPLCQ